MMLSIVAACMIFPLSYNGKFNFPRPQSHSAFRRGITTAIRTQNEVMGMGRPSRWKC